MTTPEEPARTGLYDFSPLPAEMIRGRDKVRREPSKEWMSRVYWTIGAVGALLSAAYVVSCLYEAYLAFVLNGYVEKAITAPSSVSSDDLVRLARTWPVADDLNLLSFWAMFLTVVIWMAVLSRKANRIGHRQAVRRVVAWQVWRVAIWVAVVLALVVQAPKSGASLSSLLSTTDKLMIFYVARAVVGGLYAWVSLSVTKSVLPVLRGEAQPQPDVYDLANAEIDSAAGH